MVSGYSLLSSKASFLVSLQRNRRAHTPAAHTRRGHRGPEGGTAGRRGANPGKRLFSSNLHRKCGPGKKALPPTPKSVLNKIFPAQPLGGRSHRPALCPRPEAGLAQWDSTGSRSCLAVDFTLSDCGSHSKNRPMTLQDGTCSGAAEVGEGTLGDWLPPDLREAGGLSGPLLVECVTL